MQPVVHSLRRTLQSTTLLAVVAGYLLLLVTNQFLSNHQRYEAHFERVKLIEDKLRNSAAKSEDIESILKSLWAPGFQIKTIGSYPSGVQRKAYYRTINQEQWLETVVSLSLPRGIKSHILVAENVTDSFRREWLSQMLLIVAACVSSLVTSALLRPVFRRGLINPLGRLCRQLDETQAPLSGEVYHIVEAQPVELQPIVSSFNALQDRLACSWQRERSFVDGVAHELRTPITLISGHAQSLLRDPLPPVQSRGVHLIEQEAARMASLVTDLLALARQDAGRLHLAQSCLDSVEQILRVYERLQPSSKGRLRLGDIDPTLNGVMISADEDLLQQCMAALVENAMLYAPEPSEVRLHLSRKAEFVLFRVVDSGPGVAAGERDLIFERFSRGANSKDVRGSGIGLAVVSQLMAAMNGKVDVVDVRSGGADFRLHFPISLIAPLS